MFGGLIRASRGLLARDTGAVAARLSNPQVPTTNIRPLASSAPTLKEASELQATDSASQKSPAIREDEAKELHELKTARPLLYPDQMEWLDDRLVRISRPTKNVMQSGTAYTNCWKIEFNSEPRYEYWLMGWTGSDDPVSNLTLTFPTKESAIQFCEKNKLQWFVEEQPERKIRRKSYADNFSWNKRTRTSNK